jgi:hypothetical protein
MRLKEALSSSGLFRKVSLCGSLREALPKDGKNSVAPHDVIFLIQEFKIESLAQFIKQAQENRLAVNAAFVLVCPESGGDETHYSNFISIGIDTILRSPFSVERINEVVEIVSKLCKEKSNKKYESAFQLMIKQIHSTLSKVTAIQRSKGNTKPVIESLKNICSTVHTFDDSMLELFHSQLIDHFENIPAPKKSRYNGASSRVRKKFEALERTKSNE